MEQKMKQKTAYPDSLNRKRDIDLIKTLSVFCIVCIHACGNGYYRPIGSFDWVGTVFWGCAVRAGVPLFFMCSGALMLNPEKPLPLKKLYGKNLLRLVLALFFWAAIYGVVRLSDANNLNPASLLQLAKNLLLFRHEQHLYFLHIMLLVYAVLPVTRCFVKAATRRQLEYALVIWFLVGILYPSVRPYWPFRNLTGIPAQWGLNLTWASVGYGLLGWYLQAYPLRQKWVAALTLAIGFALTFAGTWYLSARNAAFNSSLLNGANINIFLMAVGIYALCIGTFPGKWVEFFSKASFCVYLAHMLFLIFFANLPPLSVPYLFSIPLLALLAIGGSLLLYVLLRYVPFVKRWLI